MQCDRAYHQLKSRNDALSKYTFLVSSLSLIKYMGQSSFRSIITGIIIFVKRTLTIIFYLRQASLRDQNQVLFFHLVLRHLKEILPIIYTYVISISLFLKLPFDIFHLSSPTVGLAIEQYSLIFRRPDGLFLNYPDASTMKATMLNAKKREDVDLIVVTDSEGILGIGDMGTGGILICVGKGNIYTLGAGEFDVTSLLSSNRTYYYYYYYYSTDLFH